MNQSDLYKTIRIREIRKVMNDFRIYRFDDSEILYKAGQYLTFVHPGKEAEIRRSYSIASTPGLEEDLSVGVKRIPNGFFSRLLIDHAEVGDELLTTGAGGLFILPPDADAYRQIFFFAAGSGITPIFSLIKSILHFHLNIQVILIYSNHSIRSAIFYPELKILQQQFSNRFTVEWLFSDSPDLQSARLYRDLLIRLLFKLSFSPFEQSLFYLCGPLSYMRMCTFVLQELNVSPQNIKRENFLIAQPKPPVSLPPDTQSHTATIHFKSKTYSIIVHYPDSILSAAKQQGVSLPYSCETGRCANCLARCIKGKVWLSHNEVLTEKELLEGLTLTCVGHPFEGDVELIV